MKECSLSICALQLKGHGGLLVEGVGVAIFRDERQPCRKPLPQGLGGRFARYFRCYAARRSLSLGNRVKYGTLVQWYAGVMTAVAGAMM